VHGIKSTMCSIQVSRNNETPFGEPQFSDLGLKLSVVNGY
jgi:hypothetical protein